VVAEEAVFGIENFALPREQVDNLCNLIAEDGAGSDDRRPFRLAVWYRTGLGRAKQIIQIAFRLFEQGDDRLSGWLLQAAPARRAERSTGPCQKRNWLSHSVVLR